MFLAVSASVRGESRPWLRGGKRILYGQNLTPRMRCKFHKASSKYPISAFQGRFYPHHATDRRYQPLSVGISPYGLGVWVSLWSPRHSSACTSFRSRMGTGRFARPWEHCAEVRVKWSRRGLADAP